MSEGYSANTNKIAGKPTSSALTPHSLRNEREHRMPYLYNEVEQPSDELLHFLRKISKISAATGGISVRILPDISYFHYFALRKTNNQNHITMTKAEIVTEIAKSTGIDKASVLDKIPAFKPAEVFNAEVAK